MALISLSSDNDFDSRAVPPNPVAVAFAAAARAIVAWRAERARDIALHELLGMEPDRLRDLGISPYDIREAIARQRNEHN